MLDALLVPIDDQVKIGLSNYKIDLEKSQPDVIYKFWHTVHYDSTAKAYLFTRDDQNFEVNADLLKESLQITPKVSNHPFITPPSKNEIISFINKLGYSEHLTTISAIRVNNMHQPWRTFMTMINKCLTRKATAYVNQDFICFKFYGEWLQIDQVIKNLKFLNKGATYPVFGMLIPMVMLNDEINASTNYVYYLAKSKGGKLKGHGKGLMTKKGVEVAFKKIAFVRVPKKKRTKIVTEQSGQSKDVEDDRRTTFDDQGGNEQAGDVHAKVYDFKAQLENLEATKVSSNLTLSSAKYTNQFLNDNPNVTIIDVLKEPVEAEVQSLVDVPVRSEKEKKKRKQKDYKSLKKDKDQAGSSKEGKSPSKTSKTNKAVNAEETVYDVEIDVGENVEEDVVDIKDPSQTDASVPKSDKSTWFKMVVVERPESPDPEWHKKPTADDAPKQSWFNEMVNVEILHYLNKPLPLHGAPSRLTIPVDFFFKKYLDYLTIGNVGEKKYATSLTKLKAASRVRHLRLMDEFDKFAAKEGESLESMYERLKTLVNIMDRNNVRPIPVSINTKFLNCLQPELSKYVTMDGRVDIQTKNAGYGGNGNRNAGRQNKNQAFNAGNGNDESNQSVQHVPRTESTLRKSNVQCYNYNEKGHYACNCQKTSVRDAKYFREQMLLCMKDKDGGNLKDKENDFMLDNSYGEETIKELTVVVMLMARIQPANGNVKIVPSYDAKAISEVNASSKVHEQVSRVKCKTIIQTSDDDQIDSNIIFDDPYVENNGGTSKHDANTHDEYHEIQIDKSSKSKTYDFASCVSSPKTNDSFSIVNVKILPKPASIHAGRHIPAGRFNKPAPLPAGRSVLTGWTNHAARPFFRPVNLYFDNVSWPGIYNHMSMNEGRWGSAVKSSAELASLEQTATSKDVSNPFMAVMVYQKPLGYFSSPMIHVSRAGLVTHPPGGCSNNMTGILQLLRNFVEKFMGTDCFGNDHFTALTGSVDYV
nr:retrovirus-related Pol polyprotein from transposon TNT 1-94 [Tanacetum cinerariifolium]